jgi:DNA-binding transcriptional LysR family regulator
MVKSFTLASVGHSRLRYALVVSEQGSFRRAAEILGVSQSEVSRRVRALEDRLGVSLLIRSRSGSQLTSAGREILADAQFGIQVLARVTETTRSYQQLERGDLIIGVVTPLSGQTFRRLLAEYRDERPNINIVIRHATAAAHHAALHAGIVDVAFLVGQNQPSQLKAFPLWGEGVRAAVPKDHRLSSLPMIHWSDLQHEHFVVSNDGPGPEIANHIIQKISEPGFAPKITTHHVSQVEVLNLVEIGFGLTLVIEGQHFARDAGITTLPIADAVLLQITLVSSAANRNRVSDDFVNFSLRRTWSGRDHRQM